ncbi:hypothetical protein C1X64_11610 [Pseudomonas sp. GW456-E7]|nr:hypothetical protein C1X64_11610 [Pseudomonas sp. GW456-E7]
MPPFGCEAVVNPDDSIGLKSQGVASQPNGGKPPRHRVFPHYMWEYSKNTPPSAGYFVSTDPL